MVDIKKALWSNRVMRSRYNQLPDKQRRSGVAKVAYWVPARFEVLARGPIIVGSLLALLLILGRGAGSG